jgi:hypothetical protein
LTVGNGYYQIYSKITTLILKSRFNRQSAAEEALDFAAPQCSPSFVLDVQIHLSDVAPKWLDLD